MNLPKARWLSNMKESSRAAAFAFFLLQVWGGMLSTSTRQVSAQGSWNVLVENAGIASMHTMVTHFGTVLFLDRTNIGPSQINLPDGRCRDNPQDVVSTHDCTAHSVEFSPDSNRIRPLFIYTDTWCSSGQFSPDGTMVQTGGDNDGLYKIRRFVPCSEAAADCDWVEDPATNLQQGRWYASNQALPDGRQILIGGRSTPYVEFVPANGQVATLLPFLTNASDYQGDNLYPFVHLLPSGNLFIFTTKSAIVYDYSSATIVNALPNLAGTPRNYPSAGSSVMLPLQSADGYTSCEILVCGGAQLGAYFDVSLQPLASNDCGRISPLDANPTWAIELMPFSRTMGDMVLLPSLTTIIVNGAQRGSQGWMQATDAVLNPLNYDPNAAAGNRFTVWTATDIPRVYHSTANLLADGRVLIAGSNTHQFYTFTGDFPTELRVEAFSPPYLDGGNDAVRPTITDSPGNLGYGQAFPVTVALATTPAGMQFVLNSSPFTTHSFSQGQRQLNLETAAPVASGDGTYVITVTSPPNTVLAPPGYYMLFPLNAGIPGKAVWVQLGD